MYTIVIIYNANFEFNLDTYSSIWLIIWPFTVTAYLIPVQNALLIKIRDASLFLLTGGALGATLAHILKRENQTPVNIIWLILAAIAVLLHYSKSTNDRYMK